MSAPSLTANPARFASAWDAFQFAAAELTKAQRYVFLTEITGDHVAYAIWTARVCFLEKAVAATEREWRKTGPSA